MPGPIPSPFERSIRKAPLRLRVLLAVASLGEAYVGQIARHVGARRSRVRAALTGRLPGYRLDLSLVGLGLVEERRDEHGTIYRITTAGLRKARSLTAAARRGTDAEARGVRAARAWRVLQVRTAEAPMAVSASVATASFTWSL